jgi:ankyrin repeat protein
MSALIAAADRGDVTSVRRLLRKGASLSELGDSGQTAMFMAMFSSRNLVVKFLIKKGGADIDAVMSTGRPNYTALLMPVHRANYALAQWLIEESAIIPTCIWKYLGITFNLEHFGGADLSSLLEVLTLRPMSPDQDRDLPAFVSQLSPQHAELCTRGRQLSDRLPA